MAYSKISSLDGLEKTSKIRLLNRTSLVSSVLLSPTEENPLYDPRFFWEDRLYLFGVENSLGSGAQVPYTGVWDLFRATLQKKEFSYQGEPFTLERMFL